MPIRIAIDCLKCGHATSVSEDKLPYFGLEPGASLVTLTKSASSARSAAARVYRRFVRGN
jgi:hypothetical protein